MKHTCTTWWDQCKDFWPFWNSIRRAWGVKEEFISPPEFGRDEWPTVSGKTDLYPETHTQRHTLTVQRLSEIICVSCRLCSDFWCGKVCYSQSQWTTGGLLQAVPTSTCPHTAHMCIQEQREANDRAALWIMKFMAWLGPRRGSGSGSFTVLPGNEFSRNAARNIYERLAADMTNAHSWRWLRNQTLRSYKTDVA